MRANDIEIALVNLFDMRRNMIVPNVSYGLGIHEVDLLVVTPAGYASEIEIKISISDLRADLLKPHQHKSKKIKYLYFALPLELKEKAIPIIPEHAGIIFVEPYGDSYYASIFRPAKLNKGHRVLTSDELIHLGQLATMRIWTLKRKLRNIKNK